MKKLLSILLVFIFLSAQSQTVIEMRQESGIYTIPCKVNGLKLRFIFDTGASNVSMSLSEILFMLKNDYISKEDIFGVSEAQLANGDIVENTEVLLKEIEIGGIILKDVKASIIHELQAPLLLGQSAIGKLGTYQIDGSKLIINNKTSNGINNIDYYKLVKSNKGDLKQYLFKSTMKPANGTVTEIKDGVKIKEFNLTNGVYNGNSKKWGSNGVLTADYNYKNGKKEGVCKRWWSDGTLWSEYIYKSGIRTKGKSYHKNGTLKEEYINYQTEYKKFIWYKSGRKEHESYIKNGVFITPTKGYYDNYSSSLKYECSFLCNYYTNTVHEFGATGVMGYVGWLAELNNEKDKKRFRNETFYHPQFNSSLNSNYEYKKIYFENGQLAAKGEYRNKFFKNGKTFFRDISETHYKNNGTKRFIVQYDEGFKPFKQTQYHENGEIQRVIIENTSKITQSGFDYWRVSDKFYFDDGSLEEEHIYIETKECPDEYKTYYRNGQIKSEKKLYGCPYPKIKQQKCYDKLGNTITCN